MRSGVAGPTRLRIVHRSSSGNLAMFAAILRASERRARLYKQQSRQRAAGGFAFSPYDESLARTLSGVSNSGAFQMPKSDQESIRPRTLTFEGHRPWLLSTVYAGYAHRHQNRTATALNAITIPIREKPIMMRLE
jgi:hypothetical protein